MSNDKFPTAILVALLLALAARPADADLLPTGGQAPMPAVRLVDPAATAEARERRFFGRVTARETVTLSFEVGGRLTFFDAREGERVETGRVLARLDREPFERRVERAELDLAQAAREVTRADRLAQQDIAPDTRAEDAETARDLADVALRDARADLADAVLEAPFTGLVAERVARTFANVGAGEPVVTLHDLSEVHVEIELPERVLLRAGDADRIGFQAAMGDGARVPLELVEFEVQTGRVTQSFNVTLRLPREAAGDLIPGATLTVIATLPAEAPGDVLPPGAILSRSDRGFAVMVFRPDGDDGGGNGTGIVERRAVELRSPGGLTLAVIGLAPGERVVAAGGHHLADGERVRIYDGLLVEEP